MKKILSILIIIISMFASNVYASEVEITNIEVQENKHYTTNMNNPVIDNDSVDFNIKFEDYEQYIIYKITLNNKASIRYQYDVQYGDSFIDYEIVDEENIIDSKSSKDILLKVNYKDEIDESLYVDNIYNVKDNIKLLLQRPEEDKPTGIKGVIEEITDNPKTGLFLNYGLVLVLIISGTILYIRVKKNSGFKYNILIVLLVLPVIVYASNTKKITIDLNMNIDIVKPTLAVFRDGWDVNSTMMRLAAGNSIHAVKRSYENNPDGVEMQSNEVRYENPMTKSDYKIYIWYNENDKTIYYYSDAVRVSYPAAGNNFDSHLVDLEEIDNTLKADALMYTEGMFAYASTNKENVSLDISGWTFKSYASIYKMFDHFASGSTNVYVNADNWTFCEHHNHPYDKYISYLFQDFAYNDDLNVTDTVQIDANNWTVYGSDLKIYEVFYRIGKYSSNAVVNAENWNMPDILSIEELFYLTGDDVINNLTLNLSGLKAPNAKSAYKLFWNTGYGDRGAVNGGEKTLNTVIDVSDWDIGSVENFLMAFIGVCEYGKRLEITGLESWDMSSAKDCQEMFQYAGMYATDVVITDISNWNVSNVNTFYQMFECFGYYANEISLDLSNWDTSGALNVGSMFSSFGKYAKKVDLNLSGFDFSNVNTSNGTLVNNVGETAESVVFKADGLKLNGNTSFNSSFSSLGANAQNVDISISNIKMYNLESFLSNIGYNAQNVTLNISNWDMRDVTVSNPLGTLLSSARFVNIDMSNWKINSNTNLKYLVNYFGNLAVAYNIDVSNWDLGDATDLSYLFYGLAKQAHSAKIDLSGWDTSGITDMSYMFTDALSSRYYTVTYQGYYQPPIYTYYEGDVESNFEIIGIDEWDVSNVSNMKYMFSNAFQYLKNVELDLSNWNTSNVNDIYSIFSSFGSYSGSVKLNVSNWNTSGVTDARYAFSGFAYNVPTVELIGNDAWDLSNATT